MFVELFIIRGPQAELLADVELSAASPQAAVADREASRCLLTPVTRAPRQPPPGARGGRFEAAAGHVVGGVAAAAAAAAAAAGALVRVGAVAAACTGFLRAIGSSGAGNGHFSYPFGGVAFDAEGNLVVSDGSNHRLQVFRCSDGTHLRSMGSNGAGNGQLNRPWGAAFDAVRKQRSSRASAEVCRRRPCSRQRAIQPYLLRHHYRQRRAHARGRPKQPSRESSRVSCSVQTPPPSPSPLPFPSPPLRLHPAQ